MKKVIMASFAMLCVTACDEEAKADSKSAGQATEQAAEQKASAKETSAPANTFTDPRDGKKYRYVKIDEQEWMAENLNYGGNDGNFGICYNNLPENCKKYGGLYGFQQTYEACPPGWHIPSHTEWETLLFFAASESNGAGSGQALKSKTGWKQAINNRGEAMPGGSDIYGFSALPGGAAEGIYLAIGEAGNWWYSGEGGVGFVEMMYNSPKAKREVGFIGAEVANKAYSIRCVKDSPRAEAIELVSAAGTWSKLQEAYIMENVKVGSCTQIGYTLPGNGETVYFTYECGVQNGNAYWIAKNKVDLGECKAGSNWVVNMNKEIEIMLTQPDDKNCTVLTPNFCSLATSKKCQ